jgi:hypothetical protein
MQSYINWKVISVSVTCLNIVTTLSYISLMRVMYFDETLCFCKAHHC